MMIEKIKYLLKEAEILKPPNQLLAIVYYF